MPVLGKHTITRFLASDCQKQLRILLAKDTGQRPTERARNGMPPKQPPLPGLNMIAQAGDEWASTRLSELDSILGSAVLVGNRKASSRTSGIEFGESSLLPSLAAATPMTFLAEHQFSVGPTFQAEFGILPLAQDFSLTFEDLRPDLIEVRAPQAHSQTVHPDGSVTMLPPSDTRRQLRVIDIKLTSQPGPGYFAEVVYYSIALAGWLADQHLDTDFVVSADPAIWPGNHEASALVGAQTQARKTGTALTTAVGLAAIEEDLQVAPLAVFTSRLQHFFRTTLPEVLGVPWQSLPFHVTSRCRGCDFLGQEWGPNSGVSPLHCLPTAQATGHLSQIAFVGRGASQLLAAAGKDDVLAVSAMQPADPAFDRHHSLRGQRTVITSRAATLTAAASPGLVPRSGTSASIPRWSDLSVYMTADFDASSALTLALGVTAFWGQPSTFGVPRQPDSPRRVWNSPNTFVVEHKTLQREEAVVLQFLTHVDDIFQWVRAQDAARNATARNSSSVQVYIWDDLTYRHLCRLVGRHLAAILNSRNGLRSLAWLFPPEEILANSKMMAEPVVTVVSDTVRSLLALPTPHHYSLLSTARAYHRSNLTSPFDEFRMPQLHEDPLSDQIPSERAHDVWKHGPNYVRSIKSLDWAVGTRLRALEEVTRKLRDDLREQLVRRAPKLTSVAPPEHVSRLTADELLLLAFNKLNAAVDAQEVARSRAMPPHEREARFATARLSRKLTGQERSNALRDAGLSQLPVYEVYRVRDGSTQANFKDGDFMCALVPESRVEVLDWSVHQLIERHNQSAVTAARAAPDAYSPVSEVLKATLVRFDRDTGIAVLEMNNWGSATLTRRQLITDGVISLDRNVSLEKLSRDFFSTKLEETLRKIGKTPKAVESPVAVRALGSAPRPRVSAAVPVEDVIWDASAMASEVVHRDVGVARTAIVSAAPNRELNASQWSAFDHALSRRLSLIWGPPGTGKSRTLINLIVGAAYDAARAGKPVRVLVSSATYSAIDIVLNGVAEVAAAVVPQAEVWRCRNEERDVAEPPVTDCPVLSRPGPEQQRLQERLTAAVPHLTIVGASPQQIHKFACAVDSAIAPLFDLIVIDEASQIDVANAVLPLATLATGGSVVIAGDPLQLPPIHRVDPPTGAEALVGSIYEFLRIHHGLDPQALMVNYRSNDKIVELARDAAYPPGLVANSPNLRLILTSPLPGGVEPPLGWPPELPWSAGLIELLEPSKPVTCLVYRDGLSGQSNPFEAQTVAGLAWLLHNRMGQLAGEVEPSGGALAPSGYTQPIEEFLATGLGVVTPHRAQQSMITSLLKRTLPGASEASVRGAVDTVERFQGQQRDVIIGSYAVGDPDTIADEDEFLQSLNRFNVMASRARAKVIVLISEELVQHLPTDIEVLRASGLLKSFVDTRCVYRRPVDLAVMNAEEGRKMVSGSLRWS